MLGHDKLSRKTGQSVMDKLAAMRAFVAVQDAGGFAAAARRTGQSRSALNRKVLALEAELDVQLFNRSTRHVAPTETGRAYYERCRVLLAELEEAERALARDHVEPRGNLRLNAPMSFGTLHLGPALADFMVLYPALRIELVLDDRFVDPIAEGFDLIVRIGVPDEETTLVDHRIAPVRRVICAAPSYLERAGRPSCPAELAGHACLYYGQHAPGHVWRLEGPDGPVTVPVETVMCSNNAEVLRDAAVRGLGLALLPTFIAGADLQEGRLVTVLEAWCARPLMLQAIYPPSRHLSSGVRVLTDFLTERFGGQPYWDLVR